MRDGALVEATDEESNLSSDAENACCPSCPGRSLSSWESSPIYQHSTQHCPVYYFNLELGEWIPLLQSSQNLPKREHQTSHNHHWPVYYLAMNLKLKLFVDLASRLLLDMRNQRHCDVLRENEGIPLLSRSKNLPKRKKLPS